MTSIAGAGILREIRLHHLWSRAAAEWGQSHAAVLVLFVLPVVIALLGITFGVLGKEVYKAFTAEDRFAENLQVLLFLAAAVLSVLQAKRLQATRDRPTQLFYLLAAAALFVIAGEEISWGQRILGWSTPDVLEEVNRQGETNVHNIYGLETAFNIVLFLVTGAGTVLPILLLFSGRLARRVPQLARILPHYTLVPYFALPFLWRLYRFAGPVPEEYRFAIAEYAEVMELLFALGVFLVLVYQRRATSALTRDPRHAA